MTAILLRNESPTPFRDRRDGGRRLVRKLTQYRDKKDTVVLGLPRGGVVTAAEIATGLRLPVDVVIARKIGAPGNPELAIGAVAEDGDPYLKEESVALTGASAAYVSAEVKHQRAEIARRRAWFRGGRPLSLPAHATVILVDDGVATGSTVIAAIRALRQLRVARIVLAVPVAPPDTVEALRSLVDEMVVLATPVMFWAVGEFYEDFAPVSDEEVARLLARTAGRQSSSAPHGAPRPGSAGRSLPPEGRRKNEVSIDAGGVVLRGVLRIPPAARGIVLFAHGSGSGRLSPRNTYVADVLDGAGFATLLLDLLSDEEAEDRQKVFDVALLAERLRAAAAWVGRNKATRALPLGYFGASTGAAAALIAAAFDRSVRAVVSRGGRPDLAEPALPSVAAPTRLIVGGADDVVLRLNEEALARLRCEKDLEVVPGAGHLFTEPGALEEVSRLAAEWFERHLAAHGSSRAR
jgi:putative phosphoribosyl transferase